MIALSVVVSVGLVVGGCLLALRMVLAHKSKALEHAPLAQMEARLGEMENRLFAVTQQRR